MKDKKYLIGAINSTPKRCLICKKALTARNHSGVCSICQVKMKLKKRK